jgi:hypothetical protein
LVLGVISEIGISTLRLWVAAGSAALLTVIVVLALVLPRTRTGAALRATLVILAAIVGAVMVWTFAAAAEWQRLEMRAQALNAQALTPGSPLSCLDVLAGEGVGAACEKDIFASPADVATAISYTAARLALLADMAAYTANGGANIDEVLLPLRSSLEADRFGIVAYVLAMRDGCTSQVCQAFALLHDTSQVRANLSDATLSRHLERYLLVWAKPPEAPVAAANPVQPSATAQAVAPPRRVNIDFPTAASIPAVSIMNPEPTGPVVPGAAAAAAANPNPPLAASPYSRRSRKQAANPPAQTGGQSIATGTPAAVEPIWPEPVPPPPQQTAPAAAAPVQLTPFQAPPQASVAAPARAQ